ncbi:MAG: hypothetical protein ISS76_16440 [Phycisphaerae bacterium]|nr:hypothetical protein [Phycisphaerae bacterium]
MRRIKGLSIVEVEYRRMLLPELEKAVSSGEPERAATFAKALAKLRRKELMALTKNRGENNDH